MDLAGGVFWVVLPYAAIAMGADSFELGILGALRGGAYISALAIAAHLTDRINRKTLLALATTGMVIMFLATAAASTLWQLCVTSALWTASLAFFWPSVMAWLGDTHSKEELAPATGAFDLSWSTGAMIGGFLAGWLFLIWSPLPFLLSCIPAALACAVMLLAPRGQGHPKQVERSESRPGDKRELVSVWLGNISGFCLIGLMSCVFPKFGVGIGVNAFIFGVLMAVAGLGRTAIFLLGIRWGRIMHLARLSIIVQIIAAITIMTVCRVTSHIWLALVFMILGVNIGVTYYRGLYKSLEGEGSRGMKSALHEATLFIGVLLGSFVGGYLAKAWDQRAPYVVFGGFALILVLAQIALVASVHRAHKNAKQHCSLR